MGEDEPVKIPTALKPKNELTIPITSNYAKQKSTKGPSKQKKVQMSTNDFFSSFAMKTSSKNKPGQSNQSPAKVVTSPGKENIETPEKAKKSPEIEKPQKMEKLMVIPSETVAEKKKASK